MSKFKSILVPTIIVVILALYVFFTSGCNRQLLDTTWKFDHAYIYLDGEVIKEGSIQSWTDFKQSDMIQIQIDRKMYLTHSSNVVLVSK